MKLKINNVRLAFPALFEAKTVNGEGEPAFSAVFILPPNHPQFAEIDAAIKATAVEKWGAKAEATLAQLKASGKVCFRSGADKLEYDGFEGNWYISSRSKTRPTVIDRLKAPLTAADGKPYGGCYVVAILELWAQENRYGKRINAQLTGVQFARDGDSFGGGRVASADEFDSLEVPEDDPMA